MSYWHWNLWRQDCRDILIWTVMLDPRLSKYSSGIYVAISEPGLPGIQAAFQMDWCDTKRPWAPAVLASWQRSPTSQVSSILGMWFFCVLEALFLLTIVCTKTSLPSFQGFLLCNKLSGRLFENWSLILSQTCWHYNFLFQTGTNTNPGFCYFCPKQCIYLCMVLAVIMKDKILWILFRHLHLCICDFPVLITSNLFGIAH